MNTNSRFHSLDSLRGMASLQVVIGHCVMVLPVLLWLKDPGTIKQHNLKFFISNSPFHFFYNASAAVIVFFVLSGFVLSLPYYKEGKAAPNYYKFFIKRILRLYIPCLVIILISMGLQKMLYTPGGADTFLTWLRDLWNRNRSVKEWEDVFLLSTHFDDIDPALWTLPIELKLSLILPFLVYVQKRANLFWSIAIVFICAIFYHVFNHLKVGIYFPDFALFYYFTFFALGSLLAKYRATVIGFINSIQLSAYLLFVACSVVVYTFIFSFWWLPAKVMSLLMKAEHYIYGVAGGMFVMIALSSRAQALFNSKFFMFFGKVSFSLYLIHQVIIGAFGFALNGRLDPSVIVIIGLTVSIVSSIGYYHWVEVPGINIGNYVSTKIVGMFGSKKETAA